MKYVALLFALTPWIGFAFFKFAESIGVTGSPSEIFPYLWLAVSPVATGIAMFIAHVEGRQP